jgi:cytochrome c oxidase assembly protein subunit 15
MGVIRAWLTRPRVLVQLALSSVAANVVIVVTGGAVRLTGSGLGCPTWPSCTDSSLTPTPEYSFHGVIEFANRQLTFVLGLIAALTLVAAIVQRRQIALAVSAFAGVPAQAVIGGISVRTELNPWVVALHFLLSMAIIAVTMVLWWRVREPPARPVAVVPSSVRLISWLVTAQVAVVIVVGTVVTGSGPHAGDRNASGRVHRTGLAVGSMTQLHADLVMVLVGLTVGLVALVYAVRLGRTARLAAWTLLAVQLGQAVVGYTQYFLKVPPLLVSLHMLGACAVWIAALRLLLTLTSSQQLPHRVDKYADDRADHGAVEADELQVTPDL